MVELKPIAGTELTEYVVQLLCKRNIRTVLDFLETDSSKLVKAVNLSLQSISDIRQRLYHNYGPKTQHAAKMCEKNATVAYGTGIPSSLDEILAEDLFASGMIWEVCGPSGAGKSQLCLTIALNFLTTSEGNALLIDTKGEYFGTRVRQMLQSRNVDKASCGYTMNKIMVQRIHTIEEILATLNHFESELADTTNVRLIVIDALPILWLKYQSDRNRLYVRNLFAQLANLMWKMALQRSIAFLVVNLTIVPQDLRRSMDERPFDDEEEKTQQSGNNEQNTRPALGQYWMRVPRVRIAVEFPKNGESKVSNRVLTVLKACYNQTGEKCSVRITDAGVVNGI